MLTWINGAFGAGKTSVARALSARWKEALLFDPEQIGFMLRRVVPMRPQGDFQDLPLWRELTLRALMGTLAQHQRPLIVPMTLVHRRYFDEIIGGLWRGGVEVHHFSLIASPATLRRRLRWRLALPGSRQWARAQIGRCVAALEAPEFAVHVNTDDRPVSGVVEEILAFLPKPLPTTVPALPAPAGRTLSAH